MDFCEGIQLFAGDFHAVLDEINTNIFQFAKKWSWKVIVSHQRCFFRKLPDIFVSFAPKYVNLQGFKYLQQHAIPISNFQNVKIYSSK